MTVVIVPQHFGSLVFDRATSRYLPFDHETTAILRRALAESAWSFAEVDFVERVSELGWLTPDGRLAGVALAAEPPADHLLGPLAVHLEIIAACNLSCVHCFAGDLPRKTTLTVAELDGLFGQLAALGSFRLGLTGGEPLLRKDLLDVIDAALAHRLHPCLTTNGLLLDAAIARELARRDLVWLNVSLDGACAATNDAIRGAGTFERVVANLRALRGLRFTLAFTITRDNAAEVEACARLARELGAHTAVFRPLYPAGVAKRHPELAPSFADYAGAVVKLAGDCSSMDTFGPAARVATQAATYAGPGCGAANLVASISSNGDVNPCSFLGAEFDAGNLRARPFRAIWDDSQVFRRLRAPAPGDTFRGGCRARALAAHGDAFARDPWHDEWVTGVSPTTPTTNVVRLRVL